MAADTNAIPVTTYSLDPRTELRLEVPNNKDVFVTLQEGSAEIFGTELDRGKKVNVCGQKLAVYTMEGCKVKVEGRPDVIYSADETPMSWYLNVHHILNNQRRAAAETGDCNGPRCIIVGPSDSGKSTLARMLCNWAVRADWPITFVDLDIGQGSITVPGCVAATPVECPIDVEEGFPVDVPLVFHYGHVTPSENPELYKFLVDRMADILDRRAAAAPQVAAAGMVINTMGWIDGLGYELLVHAISALKADVVAVVDQDRLYSQLQAELKGRRDLAVSMVKLGKSGGVVTRPSAARKEARLARTRQYFYGVPKTPLTPFSTTALLDELLLFRIGAGHRAPSHALPLGAVSIADPLRVTPVPVSPELVHSLVAVSHAKTPQELLLTNIAGFILITNVDVARGVLTYLAPCPGPPPGKYLLTGTIQAFMH